MDNRLLEFSLGNIPLLLTSVLVLFLLTTGRVPDDVTELNDLYLTTQNCILLLMLKNHFKEVFGFTDV